jgi:rod shape-determining protein MreC
VDSEHGPVRCSLFTIDSMRFIYSKIFIRSFAAFLLVAAFVVSDQVGFSAVAKSAFHKAYGDVSGVFANATNKTKDFFEAFALVRNLVSDNAQLNQKIDELSFENARLKQSQQENIALRQALRYANNSDYQMITAQVKFLDPTGFTRTVTIDRGSQSGIREGQAAVTAPGLLVGKVTRVYPDTSEVTLVTDPGISINGEVADSGARGLVRGEHGLGLVFDLVTQNEVIKAGDLITTSGLGNDFPAGLLVGEIVGIQSSTSELFQKAFVSPAAELRNLRFLFVIQ